MHSLVIVISVLTYVLTTRIGEERRPPSIAIAWVLGLIAIPYLALPTYLLFGRRKLQRKPCPPGIRSRGKHWAEELIESFGLPPAALRRRGDRARAYRAVRDHGERREPAGHLHLHTRQ